MVLVEGKLDQLIAEMGALNKQAVSDFQRQVSDLYLCSLGVPAAVILDTGLIHSKADSAALDVYSRMATKIVAKYTREQTSLRSEVRAVHAHPSYAPFRAKMVENDKEITESAKDALKRQYNILSAALDKAATSYGTSIVKATRALLLIFDNLVMPVDVGINIDTKIQGEPLLKLLVQHKHELSVGDKVLDLATQQTLKQRALQQQAQQQEQAVAAALPVAQTLTPVQVPSAQSSASSSPKRGGGRQRRRKGSNASKENEKISEKQEAEQQAIAWPGGPYGQTPSDFSAQVVQPCSALDTHHTNKNMVVVARDTALLGDVAKHRRQRLLVTNDYNTTIDKINASMEYFVTQMNTIEQM
jgi:hypothetical protein